MISFDEARRIVLENTCTLGSEVVDILSSLGRVLAEDIFAGEDVPPFNNSAMDGYAVLSDSLKGSSYNEPSVLREMGMLPAGYTFGDVVKQGTTIKIMTGAPVPGGADAVVPIEFAEVEGSTVKIFKEASKWENIRFSGEDVRRGQLVISRGKSVRPAEIGMLAALNFTKVCVHKVPRISILITGDEILDLGHELVPGKVRDVNSYSLYAQVLGSGCLPLNLGLARDSKEEIRERLEGARESDIIIISGGASAGDCDYTKSVLCEMGMEEKFWRVAMKPGKPVIFGIMGNSLVFGLPGNPSASMVAFEQLVLPAIRKLQGKINGPWSEVKAVLEEDIKKKPGMMHFLRGKTLLKDGRFHVRSAGSQKTGVFSSMVLADCFIIIPEDVSEIKRGEEVLIQISKE